MKFNQAIIIQLFFLFFITEVNKVAAQSNLPFSQSLKTALVHPGGLQTQEAMNVVRSKVATNSITWNSEWISAQNMDINSNYVSTGLSSTLTNKHLLQNEGHAAYVLAIKWVASGDTAYADAAIGIINNWVNTVDTLAFTEAPFRDGIGSIQMANAAEIFANAFEGSAGWKNPQVDTAKKMVSSFMF